MAVDLDTIAGDAEQRERLASRLAARSEPVASGCIVWAGSKTPKGYGMLRFGPRPGVVLYTHRIAAWLAFGSPARDGDVVMHSCDNPSCCNPEHLRYGSASENSKDMVAKRRQQHGSAHYRAKLVEADIPKIMADSRSLSFIASDFGVDLKQIHRIKQGTAWRHCSGGDG